MPEDLTLPQPGTCHPRYERIRADLERWLAEQDDRGRLRLRSEIRVLEEIPVVPSLTGPDQALPELGTRLTFWRNVEAAPYAGTPFAYWWWCLIDNAGRGIASPRVHMRYLWPWDPAVPFMTADGAWL